MIFLASMMIKKQHVLGDKVIELDVSLRLDDIFALDENNQET